MSLSTLYSFMEKTKMQRSKSSTRPASRPYELSSDQILKIINPLNKPTIELEDMKRILQKIPESSRVIVQKLFHSYIFNSKSFELDNLEFCKLYDQMISPRIKGFNESPFRSHHINESRMTENTKTNSICVDYEKRYNKKNEVFRRISAERASQDLTYAQLYKEKKKNNLCRKSYRKNTQPYEISPILGSSPLQKSVESFNTHRPLKKAR
ncbi:hypothetical protein SteCoe_25095 [Stentor coeruleus]|uniref:EF-hand domain-containing protein n=1 Tax=Stentor coeruleus TaxID=5963 RepID=A0A1R2BG49_9CILI|nr:hypothetical protein SteCoe_25095 [Stentor coeruleus]